MKSKGAFISAPLQSLIQKKVVQSFHIELIYMTVNNPLRLESKYSCVPVLAVVIFSKVLFK